MISFNSSFIYFILYHYVIYIFQTTTDESFQSIAEEFLRWSYYWPKRPIDPSHPEMYDYLLLKLEVMMASYLICILITIDLSKLILASKRLISWSPFCIRQPRRLSLMLPRPHSSSHTW